MNLAEWNDNLSVGVRDLDEDHKVIIALINELYTAMREGEGEKAASDVIKSLVDYMAFHFKREEDYFEQTNYPKAEEHKQQHEDLADRVLEIQKKRKDSDFAADVALIQLLGGWLDEHIHEFDKRYSAHLNSHGIV